MKNTLSKILFALATLAIFAISGHAQTILSTTTLGAAITTTNGTSITVASTSTMQSAGAQNQINTALYVDQEFMNVITVVDSTHLVVQRHVGIGIGGKPTTHKNGATVWFANSVTNGTNVQQANAFFSSNSGPEDWGQCQATQVKALPRINTYWGTKADCLGVGTAGQWVRTDAPGYPVLGATQTLPAGVATIGGTIFLSDTATNAVTGFNVPNGAGPGFSFSIIPGGAFTTTTATNIRIASTAVVGKTLTFTWDGTKWDPSY